MRTINLNDIPAAKKKSQVIANVVNLIALGKEYLVPSTNTGEKSRYNGTGGPGYLHEDLNGADGNSKHFADQCGIELKFWGGSCMLTLSHCEVEGGNDTIRKMILAYGKIREDGLKSFYHTVTSKSFFEIVFEQGRVVVRPKTGQGPSASWPNHDIRNLISKWKDTIVVFGKVRKDSDGQRYVRFLEALHCTGLKSDDVMELIKNGEIKIDFDARQLSPCNPDGFFSIKSRGTKFRLALKRKEDLLKAWRSAKSIAIAPEDADWEVTKVIPIGQYELESV